MKMIIFGWYRLYISGFYLILVKIILIFLKILSLGILK